MTLDRFIALQKVNLEKFRNYHIKGVKQFDWPTNQEFSNWEDHYSKWSKIWDQWLRECGEIE